MMRLLEKRILTLKVIQSTVIAMFGVFILTGCAIDESVQQEGQRIPLEFSVNTLEMTRATGDQQSTQFDDGTEVLVNLSLGTAAAQDCYFKYKVANNLLVPLMTSGGSETTLYYPAGVSGDAETDVTINYAYAPATKTAGLVTVESNQTSTPDYKLSDLVWLGSTTLHRPASYTTTPVSLIFKHMLTKFSIKVTKGIGIGAITSIILKDMKNGYIFTPSAAEASVVTTTTGSQDITIATGADLAGENYYTAIVPAQTISNSVAFLEITTDVGTASYKLDADKTLVAGKQYGLDITVNFNAVNTSTVIADWTEEVARQIEIGTIDDASFVYNGEEKTPEPAVTCHGIALTKDVDYMLTYHDNVNAGTATVVAIGIGTYAGNVATANFNIRKAAGTISYSITNPNIPRGVGTYTNTLNITGDGTVSYGSGSTSVATIDNSTGMVTLVTTGSSVITATVTDGVNYTYASPSASYTLTVSNNTLATLKASPNSNYVGYCVSSDGYLFPSGAECTDAGQTPVGLVAYVGGSSPDASNSGYRILVLALNDRTSSIWCRYAGEECTTNPITSVSTGLSYLDGISKTNALIGSSTQPGNYNAHRHLACINAQSYSASRPSGASIWFLPSMGQWNLMVKALVKKAGGTAKDMSMDRNDDMCASVYNHIITNAGGTILSASGYWTSTEYSVYDAWFYQTDFGYISNWTSSGHDNKRDNKRIRSAFAY